MLVHILEYLKIGQEYSFSALSEYPFNVMHKGRWPIDLTAAVLKARPPVRNCGRFSPDAHCRLADTGDGTSGNGVLFDNLSGNGQHTTGHPGGGVAGVAKQLLSHP